jgi:hypothetical protein
MWRFTLDIQRKFDIQRKRKTVAGSERAALLTKQMNRLVAFSTFALVMPDQLNYAVARTSYCTFLVVRNTASP